MLHRSHDLATGSSWRVEKASYDVFFISFTVWLAVLHLFLCSTSFFTLVVYLAISIQPACLTKPRPQIIQRSHGSQSLMHLGGYPTYTILKPLLSIISILSQLIFFCKLICPLIVIHIILIALLLNLNHCPTIYCALNIVIPYSGKLWQSLNLVNILAKHIGESLIWRRDKFWVQVHDAMKCDVMDSQLAGWSWIAKPAESALHFVCVVKIHSEGWVDARWLWKSEGSATWKSLSPNYVVSRYTVIRYYIVPQHKT